jgi:hypothetical protein
MRRTSSSPTKSFGATCFDRRRRLCDRGRRDGPLRHVRLALVTALIPVALASATMLPAAASAATRGFRVYNVSSYPIKFVGVSGTDFGGTPAAGNVLQPGVGYDDFEEVYHFGSATAGTAAYQILGAGGQPIGTFNANMAIESISTSASNCSTDVGTCTPLPVNGHYILGATTLTLLDPPGTVHNLPAGHDQAQADALNQFCTEDNAATCTFTPTSETSVYSPTHQVGSALVNNTPGVSPFTTTASDMVGSSDSIGVDVKAGGKIAGIVDFSITAKYSHEWTMEHTFTQSVTQNCPGYTKCWITDTAPMRRDTGEFTLTLGNTTWNLAGVYFDTPDPNGNGTFEINQMALNPSQRAILPRGVTMQKLLRGIYTLPAGARASRIAQPQLHLSIAGPPTIAAGQIATYHMVISRSQPNNRLAYALTNVQVLSTRAGHRVGRSLLSALPRGQLRTLDLRLTVPSAHGSFCVAVSAAARHALSAHARFCTAVAAPPVSGLG